VYGTVDENSPSHSGSAARKRTVSIDILDPRQRRSMSRSASQQAMRRDGSSSSVLRKQAFDGDADGGGGGGGGGGGSNDGGDDGDELEGGSGGKAGPRGEEPEQVLSRLAVFALTVNFIIGVGILDLPYIFYGAGLVVCIILVLLATAGSNLSASLLLESEARGIMRDRTEGSAVEAVDHWYKIELSELCEIFVGNWFKFVYLAVFFIFQTSTLWSYSSVFSLTAASIMSPAFAAGADGANRSADNLTCDTFDETCYDLYYVSLTVFAVCEIIMTVVGLKELAVVQTILAIYRFAAAFCMAMLAIIGLGE
jgi:hypothetical protein